MNANVNPEAEEKELVWKFFGRKPDGVFVEVGANDPVAGSQTWLLEQNGWRGVLVEPQASLCEKLRPARPRSQVFQVACSCPGSEGEADLILTEYDGNATLEAAARFAWNQLCRCRTRADHHFGFGVASRRRFAH